MESAFSSTATSRPAAHISELEHKGFSGKPNM